MTRARAVALAAILSSSCGASLMKLPQGPGAAATDAREALTDATVACHAVTTMTADIAVSGSVSGRRVRARLFAGLAAPDAARLEAVALGQPFFILVAHSGAATLLLQRDNRVLEQGPPDAVVEAATGLPVDPSALRAMVTGCTTTPDWTKARALGDDWRVLPDAASTVYLHRPSRGARWHVAAVAHRDSTGAEWRVEYRDYVNGLAGLPHDIRLRSSDATRFDLHLRLSQIETNATLDPRTFQVQVPASAERITLKQLQDGGPFGSVSSRDDGR